MSGVRIKLWTAVCIFYLIQSTNGSPTTIGSIVPQNDEPTTLSEETTVMDEADSMIDAKPKITSMEVNTNISARYAKTLVTSRVYNPASKAKEVTFSIVIPETAFITGFSMEIGGKVYDAYVKEKEEAKKVYDAAVSSGQSAAHVAVQARDSNHFTVSINLEPTSKAIFRLRYEELLTRRLGLYNNIINLNPGQIVDKLSVDVDIYEKSPINILLVPELRSGNEIDADASDKPNPLANKFISEDKLHANIHFSPNKEQQLEMMEQFKKEKAATTPAPFAIPDPFEPKREEGLSGQFVVQYDVDVDNNGEVLINDGYFVHFFAPKDINVLSKHVVFVLDVSGSMYGKKIAQLKEAMNSILQELNPNDYFNIIEFSYNAKVYDIDDVTKSVTYGSRTYGFYYDEPKEVVSTTETIPPKPMAANKDNIAKAKQIIDQLSANGGTNIHEALTTAYRVANLGIEIQKSAGESLAQMKVEHEPIIVFLTDGDPTVGETNTNTILTTVKDLNKYEKTLFTLAFGEDADRNFLRKLSLQNFGFMRHIYEASDAALQIKNFYRQISSPVLANVKYIYPDDQIEENSTTRITFNHFFLGSELVVAGKLFKPKQFDNIKVIGNSGKGPIDFIPIVKKIEEKKEFWPLERLWAHLTIKQLLDESESKEDKDLKKKALDIALKYSFVTPLTSLVVVKPNETASVDPEALPGSGTNNKYSSFALPLIATSGGSAAYGGGAGFGGAAPAASHYMMSSPSSSYASISSYPASTRFGGISMRTHAQHSYPQRMSSGGYSTSYSASNAADTGGIHQIIAANFDESDDADIIVYSAPESFDTALSGPPLPQAGFAAPASYPQSTLLGGSYPLAPPAPTYRPHPHPPPPPPPPRTTTAKITSAEESLDLTTVAESTESTVDKNVTDLAKYGLEDFEWLKSYLSPNDSITIPTGSQDTLLKLKSADDVEEIKSKPCDNSLSGGSGECRYLTKCNDLKEGFKDLTTYVKYWCNLEGYAGICCKSS